MYALIRFTALSVSKILLELPLNKIEPVRSIHNDAAMRTPAGAHGTELAYVNVCRQGRELVNILQRSRGMLIDCNNSS